MGLWIASHLLPGAHAAPYPALIPLAGGGLGDGGPAIDARLRTPAGLAMDPVGNLYIADSGDGRIRRVDPGGTIATFAGPGDPANGSSSGGNGGPARQASLSPGGLFRDGSGSLYVAGFHSIRRIRPDGVIVRVIDIDTERQYSAEAMPDLSLEPEGMAADRMGHLYFTDAEHASIRKLSPDGALTTVAGTGQAGFSGDGGPARDAQLDDPRDLVSDPQGDLFVADTGNGRVREITPDGTIRTVAGGGNNIESGIAATFARLMEPTGLALDGAGNLYIADRRGGRIWRLDSQGTMTVVAGGTDSRPVSQPAGDGVPAANARLVGPTKLLIDPKGSLLFSDSGDNRVRRIGPDGILSTVAGGDDRDGIPAISATLYGPAGIAADGRGFVFAEQQGARLRRVGPDGLIQTVAGSNTADGGGGLIPGVALDDRGSIYFSDTGNRRVRKIAPDGTITTVAGTGDLADYRGDVGDGGPAVKVRLAMPGGVAVDTAGNVYIADGRVRKVSPDGTISTVAGGGTQGPGEGGPATAAELQAADVAVDGQGDLFLVDTRFSLVRKVDRRGIITTVAGVTAPVAGQTIRGDGIRDGDPAARILLTSPRRIAVDSAGSLYLLQGTCDTDVVFPGPPLLKIGPDGRVTVLPIDPAGGVYGCNLADVAVDGAGDLLLTADGYLDSGRVLEMRGVAAPGLLAGRPLPAPAPLPELRIVPAGGTLRTGEARRFAVEPDVPVVWSVTGPGSADGQGGYYAPRMLWEDTRALLTATAIGGGWAPAFAPLSLLAPREPTGTLLTVAGIGLGTFTDIPVAGPGDGRQAADAALSGPAGVAIDSAGHLYIADSGLNRIRKVGPDGRIATVAGNGIVSRQQVSGFSGDGGPAVRARLNSPLDVAVDRAGNLYIADNLNGRVRQVAPDGIITTVAGGAPVIDGSGVATPLGDGGPATAVALSPVGIAVDRAGNLYIADGLNRRVRKVDPSGVITTVAGGPYVDLGEGGPATQASIGDPRDVAVDAQGSVYILSIYGNSALGRVRKVGLDGRITTVVGGAVAFDGFGNPLSGGNGGPAAKVALNNPGGIALDGSGNLYIAETAAERIRKVAPDGTITTVAGTGYVSPDGGGDYSGDGGPATRARLNWPARVAVDPAGGLLIADFGNDRIRRVAPDGTIATVAGGGTGVPGEGGSALAAPLPVPGKVAVDASGTVFIADSTAHRIYRVAADGTFSLFAGNGSGNGPFGNGFPTGDGGSALAAGFMGPLGIAADGHGNLYVADWSRVRKIDPAGLISTVAGRGVDGYAGDGGPATRALLGGAQDVALDAAGNLYIAEVGNHRIRKVTPGGTISTVAGIGPLRVYQGFAVGGYSGGGGPATQARLNYPMAVAATPAGELYILDAYNNRVRKVGLDGIITTIAGTGDADFGGDGGPAAEASLNPGTDGGLALDMAGDLFVTDGGNARVRRIGPDGIIQTVAGTGRYINGLATVELGPPSDVAVDAAGDLLIADPANGRISKALGVAAPGWLGGRPFPSSPAPTYTPGDVDGDHTLTVRDVTLALRAALGIESLPAGRARWADIYPDGGIDLKDVLLILREVVGLAHLPA